MDQQTTEGTPNSNRWFKAGIVMALIYGITFGLDAAFNWIFFSTSAYFFFLSWYYNPDRLRNGEQQRAKQFRGGGGPTKPLPTAQLIRRVAIGIAVAFFGIFFLLIFIGIFFGDETTEGPKGSNLEIGNEFYDSESYDSAEFYYDKALLDNPEDAAALYGKGIALVSLNREEEAYPFLTKAYENGYRNGWLSLELAQMYDKRGDIPRAQELYKEAVQQDSSLVDAYNRLSELEPETEPKYKELAERWTQN